MNSSEEKVITENISKEEVTVESKSDWIKESKNLLFDGFKSAKKAILIAIIFSVILFLSMVGYKHAYKFPWTEYLQLVFILVISLSIAYSKIKFNKKIFSTMAVIMFGWFIWISPVHDTPDENNHFYRALHIYDGNVMSPTKLQDSTIYKSFDNIQKEYRKTFKDSKLDTMYLDKDSKRLTTNRVLWTAYNMSLFYVPSVVGIALADLFGGSIESMLIMARFFNGLAFIGLSYLVMRIAGERYKHLFAAFLSLPFFMFLAASVNLDSLSLAISLMAIALWLRGMSPNIDGDKNISIFKKNLVGEEGLTKVGYVTLVALILLASLSKLPYILLLGLIIPLRNLPKFTGKLPSWLIKVLTIIIGILLTAFWFSLAKTANTGMYTTAKPVEKFIEVLKFGEIFKGYMTALLIEPLELFTKTDYQFSSFTWLLYPWENSKVIKYTEYGRFILLMWLLFLFIPSKISIPKEAKYWLLLISLAIQAAVVSVGYFMWSPLDKPDVAGSLQSRYMIVAWFLMGLALNLSEKLGYAYSDKYNRAVEKGIFLFIVFIFILGAIAQLVRYYSGLPMIK